MIYEITLTGKEIEMIVSSLQCGFIDKSSAEELSMYILSERDLQQVQQENDVQEVASN